VAGSARSAQDAEFRYWKTSLLHESLSTGGTGGMNGTGRIDSTEGTGGTGGTLGTGGITPRPEAPAVQKEDAAVSAAPMTILSPSAVMALVVVD